MATFHKDLKFGKKYEKLALDYLDYDEYRFSVGCFKEYDIEIGKDGIKTTIEVKADRMAHRTGNIALEYMNRDKPSGITTSTADYWIYFILTDELPIVYKIPLSELRELAPSGRKINGGDNYKSKMYLVKHATLLSKYRIEKLNKDNVDELATLVDAVKITE